VPLGARRTLTRILRNIWVNLMNMVSITTNIFQKGVGNDSLQFF